MFSKSLSLLLVGVLCVGFIPTALADANFLSDCIAANGYHTVIIDSDGFAHEKCGFGKTTDFFGNCIVTGPMIGNLHAGAPAIHQHITFNDCDVAIPSVAQMSGSITTSRSLEPICCFSGTLEIGGILEMNDGAVITIRNSGSLDYIINIKSGALLDNRNFFSLDSGSVVNVLAGGTLKSSNTGDFHSTPPYLVNLLQSLIFLREVTY